MSFQVHVGIKVIPSTLIHCGSSKKICVQLLPWRSVLFTKLDHCWNGNSFLKSQEPGTFSRKGAVTSATFERTGREDESCCWCWCAKVNLRGKDIVILLMEEILHHLECTNPFKQRDNLSIRIYQLVQDFFHQQ